MCWKLICYRKIFGYFSICYFVAELTYNVVLRIKKKKSPFFLDDSRDSIHAESDHSRIGDVGVYPCRQ